MKVDLKKPIKVLIEEIISVEKNKAINKIKLGRNPNLVIEEMSKRINDKLLYIFYDLIKKHYSKTEEEILSNLYNDAVPKKVADHIED